MHLDEPGITWEARVCVCVWGGVCVCVCVCVWLCGCVYVVVIYMYNGMEEGRNILCGLVCS